MGIAGRATPQGSAVYGDIARRRGKAPDAYIALVNASGGIHGPKIQIKDCDDA